MSSVCAAAPVPVVLNERQSPDGHVTWQARVSDDRGRLQIVAIVAPSATATIVEPLNDAELRELLAPSTVNAPGRWTCVECGHVNDDERRWCMACSSHGGR